MAELGWEQYVGPVPPTTDAALDEAAELAGVTLPISYRDLVKVHAGEVPTSNEITLQESGGTAAWGPLLVTDPGENRTARNYMIKSAIVALHESGWERLFPIATDTANGLVCLDGREGGIAEAVIFVDLTYDPDEDGGWRTVAPSVDEALSKLS